jgi:N-acetylglucosamine-6-phosphate deacetylase
MVVCKGFADDLLKSLGIERLEDIEVGYNADMVILDKGFRVVKNNC